MAYKNSFGLYNTLLSFPAPGENSIVIVGDNNFVIPLHVNQSCNLDTSFQNRSYQLFLILPRNPKQWKVPCGIFPLRLQLILFSPVGRFLRLPRG